MIRKPAAALAVIFVTSANALAAEQSITQIFISKSDQMMRIFSDGKLVDSTRVSTGKAGHSTPSGVFSIIEKRKFHRSNIYNNAPMPFMQRLTWSGIALHEGRVPNYPASHGCIRIPKSWAANIYQMTARGTSVVITKEPVTPITITHPFLPGKAQLDSAPKTASNELKLRSTLGDETVDVATLDPFMTGSIQQSDAEKSLQTANAGPALKLLITWKSDKDKIRAAQEQLTYLGFDAGHADGVIGKKTRVALAAFLRWKNLDAKLELTSDDVAKALSKSSYSVSAANATLSVRKNFAPAASFDVEVTDRERPLGTHYLQAIAAPSGQKSAQWSAVTLPNHLSTATRQSLSLNEHGHSADQPIELVLSRLNLSDETNQYLEDNFSTSMSLTITDYDHDQETGQGTEFITVTRD